MCTVGVRFDCRHPRWMRRNSTPPHENQKPEPELEPEPEKDIYEYDLVVYGDTAAAVSAAITASREGLETALVAPGQNLGGMLTGGLSSTDLGPDGGSVIGGLAREFYERNAIKKGKTPGTVDWFAEPSVATTILWEMIDETKENDHAVIIYKGERLKEQNGVKKNGNTITEISCESGKIFRAEQFIDATYEGDLMAQAGVTYTVGREAGSFYNESLAGVVAPTVAGAKNHNFEMNIAGLDESGLPLYPEAVSNEPLAPVNSGDKKVQAYNFRLCVTQNKENMVPWPKPDGYDPTRYKLLADYVNAKGEPTANDLFILNPIGSTGKYDMNNKGAFSTDYIGGSYKYPDGTYAEREMIWEDHYNYMAGLLYFLANDESIPEKTRKSVNSWGLCKDVFTDTNNWPFQLYVREGRRMIGEYVMTQKDIERGSADRTKTDSIGMGSYNSDSHNVQRYITSDGFIRNEGNMEVRVDPYEIPYRMILPQRDEVENLSVVCTFSASHVAYSSIRMEPQYMIIGQAAGVAASLSIRQKTSLYDISVEELQNILVENYDAVITQNSRPGVWDTNEDTELPEVMPAGNIPDNYCDTLVFGDTFDNYSIGWQTTAQAPSETLIIQRNSSVIINKANKQSHGFLTRKNFKAPSGAFTYSFTAKLGPAIKLSDGNADSMAEFTVRIGKKSSQIKVVLKYNHNNPKMGVAQDGYASESQYSAQLDTSIWHNYMVVVNDDLTYSLYVDGNLLWENAQSKGLPNATTPPSDMIKIGADDPRNDSTKDSKPVNCEVRNFKLENGSIINETRVLCGLFENENGKKLTDLVNESGKVVYSAIIENTKSTAADVTAKLIVKKNGTVVDEEEKTVQVGCNELNEITLVGDLGNKSDGLTVEVIFISQGNILKTIKL